MTTLETAAVAYVNARLAAQESDAGSLMRAVCHVDATWHDLMLLAIPELFCRICAEDSCPGAIA